MKTLVIKYLTDSISDEELLILKEWLKKEENQEEFKAMVRQNQHLDLAYKKIDPEIAYERVSKAITKRKVSLQYPVIFRYAAAVAILLGISIALYFSLDGGYKSYPIAGGSQVILELHDGSIEVLDEDKEFVRNVKGAKVAIQENKIIYEEIKTADTALSYNQLTVPYGKRFNVQLQDGSFVYLNAGASLRYPTSFANADSRQVFLDGEAYFNVKKNQHLPFVVNTRDMKVKVLGTKFNVSSYHNDNSSSTVLVEGSISIYPPSEKISSKDGMLIQPGQMVTSHHDGFTVEAVTAENHITWIEGELYFKNDRFEDIIKKLERHYNITIINRYPELNNLRYTGRFRDETISQVLNTFKANTNFEYQIKDDVITIRPYSQSP